VGATLPLVIGTLAFQLSRGYEISRRLRFSLLAGGLMVMEGLTLVESRLALINLYWLWFGLVGQLCWLTAARSAHAPRGRMGAGLALGAAVNVKWNGAGFWLGLVLWELTARWRPGPRVPGAARSLPWGTLLFYLGLLPLLTYGVLWWPHLNLTGDSMGAIHQRLWNAHQTIGQNSQPHPYCSAWYTWPLMLRPVAYFHQALGQSAPGAMLAPYRAYGNPIFTLQGMGNPLLWGLGTAAVLALGLGWVSRWRQGKPPTATQPVEAFILINYLANWLPWLLVSRCTFLYHALGMVAFSTLALAWLLSRWLGDRRRSHRLMAWAMVGVIALGFLFWLPLFLGLPLSPEALQRRWWLPTWI
jgi:dolichyl-phosphate-mannose-protein mannosyltransferase